MSSEREAERSIQNRILLACSRGMTRLFRNNIGLGWVGKSKRFERREVVTLHPGDVVVRKARPLHAGLCEGSADLIGWRVVEITPDMVGARVALFVSVEVKSELGRVETEQRNWHDQVSEAGGVAVIARSVDDALRALADPVTKAAVPFDEK